ncbi:DUF2147 domain-containing protein [Bradyrhizobium daqingense]|uniref:Uncharacterized protein (DUF2147 family) n=1 Tax=Bradyrhizobium daqingense TaxID=993502 RepID=A0A562L9B1_9BRAD|nr:DUF2147 domain-containing protein [Bradyrhizobium daqingense]TWI04230.1 uncharacterized protein (DUF2147 family) [Bradyrhizobium daqingense]UFS91836.1 DUF2147 domain-containing protein [Bradyrhizobium daqingense]
MKRLAASSLGALIAIMAIAPAAEAGSYSFSIRGHRFHVEAPRHCRSASCVSISGRSLRASGNVSTAPAAQPAPAPAVQPPQPICAEPVRPPQAIMAVPPPAPPVLAATNSQPVVPSPAAKLEPPRLETPSANPPRIELERIEQPLIAPKPEIAQTAALAQANDDERYTPLGEWESSGAKGTVRIERCGPALCGFALTEASSKGESVLVNMKPRKRDVWIGSIYSRSSGNTYYATMTLKSSGKLHVEACALGRFWCSGNDWTRVEAPRGQMITTSRQWSARS